MLLDNKKLDRLHWDPTNKVWYILGVWLMYHMIYQLYSDYGLHSTAVKLVRVKSNNPQVPGD